MPKLACNTNDLYTPIVLERHLVFSRLNQLLAVYYHCCRRFFTQNPPFFLSDRGRHPNQFTARGSGFGAASLELGEQFLSEVAHLGSL